MNYSGSTVADGKKTKKMQAVAIYLQADDVFFILAVVTCVAVPMTCQAKMHKQIKE